MGAIHRELSIADVAEIHRTDIRRLAARLLSLTQAPMRHEWLKALMPECIADVYALSVRTRHMCKLKGIDPYEISGIQQLDRVEFADFECVHQLGDALDRIIHAESWRIVAKHWEDIHHDEEYYDMSLLGYIVSTDRRKTESLISAYGICKVILEDVIPKAS